MSGNSGGQSSHAAAGLVRFEHEGYCVPSILLVHELLLDGSQLFSQKVDMMLKALRNVRPSRLPDPLPPRSRLVPSIAPVSRCTVDRRSRGRRDVGPEGACRKIHRTEYICTRAVRGVTARRTGDNPRILGKSVEDPKEDERLMSD